MATEAQYKFFKDLYEEENERITILHDNAKVNTALITLYAGFMTFALEKSLPSSLALKGCVVVASASLVASFVLSLLATRISGYEPLNVPADILIEIEKDQQTDDVFYRKRIADFTVAYERNSIVNDGKASLLSYARYFLLIGIATHFAYYSFRIFQGG